MNQNNDAKKGGFVFDKDAFERAIMPLINRNAVNELKENFRTIQEELELLKGELPPGKLDQILKIVDSSSSPMSALAGKVENMERYIMQDPEKAISTTRLNDKIKHLSAVVYFIFLPLIIIIISYLIFK